jgi:YidC/Oxa1 family membrane protein insertase
LVVSQFVSMQLMQPKTDDPAQQQSNLILKLLPLMIGWFSLNVPAALCIYWVTNNVITTATSLIIKNTMQVQPISAGGGSAAASSRAAEPPTIFAPPREKPAGFGTTSTAASVKAIDAEVVPTNPKVEVEKKLVEADVEEITVEDVPSSAEAGDGSGSSDEGSKKKSGKSTRRKKRKN